VLVVTAAHAQRGNGFIVVVAADLAGLQEAGEQGVDSESTGGWRA